ncbi:MAG: hypothetical protein ACAI38_11160 [Myxococcota bacterium]
MTQGASSISQPAISGSNSSGRIAENNGHQGQQGQLPKFDGQNKEMGNVGQGQASTLNACCGA